MTPKRWPRMYPLLVDSDETLDVIGGSAGMIVVLQVLNSISGNASLLGAALLCGERLLLRQSPQRVGVGWKTKVESSQPLTGFSHGAAGIAWSLLKLASWSGDNRFGGAAAAAIAMNEAPSCRHPITGRTIASGQQEILPLHNANLPGATARLASRWLESIVCNISTISRLVKRSG